jgi:hypothetical protein
MQRCGTAFEFTFWLETLDTRQTIQVRALVDSGADGCFVSHRFIERYSLSTSQLDTPIPVRNADGSPSHGGPIDASCDVILFAPPSFRDRLQLEVATIVYDVILGHPWLQRHNPKVNWREGTMELLQDTTLSTVTTDAESQSLDESPDPYEALIASIGLDSLPKAFDLFRDPIPRGINTVAKDHSRSTTVEEDLSLKNTGSFRRFF